MCISSPETNSWSVIYRKNSGEDINITSLTFKNSLLAARTLMVPENYMICILRNGRGSDDGTEKYLQAQTDGTSVLPIISKYWVSSP